MTRTHPQENYPCDYGVLERAAEEPANPIIFDAKLNEYQLEYEIANEPAKMMDQGVSTLERGTSGNLHRRRKPAGGYSRVGRCEVSALAPQSLNPGDSLLNPNSQQSQKISKLSPEFLLRGSFQKATRFEATRKTARQWLEHLERHS